jgi:tetratricopeptide (TPR) repeat protein
LISASVLLGQPAGRDAEIQQRFQRAQQALAAKRLDDAAREFREILKLNPAIAGAYANLGLLAYQQVQYGEASRELQAALERDRSLPARGCWAENLAREGVPLRRSRLEKCSPRRARLPAGSRFIAV